MFWFGVLVALCYVPGFTGAYIATQWPVLSFVLPFFLLRAGPFTVFHAAGVLFLLYAAALVPFSPAPYASVFGLWLAVIAGLCVWFGTVIEDDRDLIAGLAVGAAVSSAVAVFQSLGVEVVPRVSTTPAGLYVNGVQQGTVLALLIVALHAKRMWWYALPLIPGLVLAQSRGAWIALVVGLVACHVRRLWVFGAVAAAGAFYFMLPLSDSDTQRTAIWSLALHNLNLTGWGPGVFYTIVFNDGKTTFFPEYAHNDAIQLVFEYGIGALLPFGIFGYVLKCTDAENWPVIVAFVAASCYSMPLYMPITCLVVFVAVGGILRSYGIAVRDGYHSRQPIVPWLRGPGGQTVSVAPHHSAKG